MSFVVARRRPLLTAMLSAALAFSPAAALAHGTGGHAGSHGHIHHHTSKKTNTNSNGKNSLDRETGHARAEDRMNQKGLDHNQAGISDTDDTTGTSGG